MNTISMKINRVVTTFVLSVLIIASQIGTAIASDFTLAEEVRQAQGNRGNVRTEVRGDTAYLYGWVEDSYFQHRIEQVAHQYEGINHVKNYVLRST